MNPAHNGIDAARNEVDKLRGSMARIRTKQVRSNDELARAKATALAWFRTHRPAVEAALGRGALEDVDGRYKEVLALTDKHAARTSYVAALKLIGRELGELRMLTLTPAPTSQSTGDQPPDFSKLVPQAEMQAILVRRWEECSRCLQGDAPLAATVMMGGLLEALLLARINREADKTQLFKSAKAPVDPKTQKAKPLKEWTLKNYIDVCHDLGWISETAKSVGAVLRDYRNCIHPYKELSHSVTLTLDDATIFWEVAKSISKQLLK